MSIGGHFEGSPRTDRRINGSPKATAPYFIIIYYYTGSSFIMSNFAVKADTSNNDKLIEVYTHDIFYYADQFIDEELDGKKDKELLKSNFRSLIYFISDNINKPDMNNIELLDSIFDIYLRLCAMCDIIPTLEAFAWLCKINLHTFACWKNGNYRKVTPEYSATVKKWQEICRGSLTFSLTQSKGGDINRIFIAKAVYGMAETAPVPAPTTQALNYSNKQLAARLGERIQEPEAIEGEIIDDEQPGSS